MIGKAYQNYELSQPNMCIIPEDLPVNTVFNKLQDIFILYDQWNQSLMDSRLRNFYSGASGSYHFYHSKSNDADRHGFYHHCFQRLGPG